MSHEGVILGFYLNCEILQKWNTQFPVLRFTMCAGPVSLFELRTIDIWKLQQS
jgi:hypothetical protein